MTDGAGPSDDSWYTRLAGTTRGRILSLLRRADRTVNELADELGVGDNTIRNHLGSLARDRLVEQRGVQRETGGKPAHLYGLTADAEDLFPKGYARILRDLLRSLSRRLGDSELEELLDEVAKEATRDLGGGYGDDLQSRTQAAARLLERLGGATRIETTEAGYVIRGNSCPLSALVADHPELCTMTAALVTAAVGLDVRESCDRSSRPRCAFRIESQEGGQGEVS